MASCSTSASDANGENMARTTDALVGGIIKVNATIPLAPFITLANLDVTEHCADSGYTSERLQQIETWLAAHYYAIRDPRRVREKAGEVSAENQSEVDLGYNVTHYGQMALRIDFQGNLARVDANAKDAGGVGVAITYLGVEENELPLS